MIGNFVRNIISVLSRKYKSGYDLSEHRIHTTKYDDLCM